VPGAYLGVRGSLREDCAGCRVPRWDIAPPCSLLLSQDLRVETSKTIKTSRNGTFGGPQEGPKTTLTRRAGTARPTRAGYPGPPKGGHPVHTAGAGRRAAGGTAGRSRAGCTYKEGPWEAIMTVLTVLHRSEGPWEAIMTVLTLF